MADPLNPSNLNNPPPDTNITTTDVDTVTRASAALKELESIQEKVGKSAAKATEEMSEQNDTLEKAKGFLKSLIPEGLDIKVQRYFPLAHVLAAFDGAIAATVKSYDFSISSPSTVSGR